MKITISTFTLGALLLAGCAKQTVETPEPNKAPAPAAAAPVAAVPAAGAARETPLEIGAGVVAKDESMEATDGKKLTLASVATEKGSLVFFTCNHCPWAKAWESRLVELGNLAQEKGLGVVAINPNDPDDNTEDGVAGMKERVSATSMKFPYVVDASSNVARAFGATKTPEVFLFDGQSKLVYYGAIDDNAKEPDKVQARYLKDALEALLAQKPIPVAATKAFGCGIKFRSPAS